MYLHLDWFFRYFKVKLRSIIEKNYFCKKKKQKEKQQQKLERVVLSTVAFTGNESCI